MKFLVPLEEYSPIGGHSPGNQCSVLRVRSGMALLMVSLSLIATIRKGLRIGKKS
jgi:hypothetical protein